MAKRGIRLFLLGMVMMAVLGGVVVVPMDYQAKKRGYVLLFLVQSLNMLPAMLLAAP